MKPGYRKFTVGMTGLVLAFVLALKNQLTAEFSTIVSVVVASFAAANAYTTGKGNEPQPANPGSAPGEQQQ